MPLSEQTKETRKTWLYRKTQLGLCQWTVGFYDPNGNWEPESDYESSEDAAKRVHYLNGGVTGIDPRRF